MLVEDVKALLEGDKRTADLLGLGPFEDLPDFLGALFRAVCTEAVGRIVAKTYREAPAIVAATERDIFETARRNFEPGGPAATVLFSRGVHATIAHRIAHRLWQNGDTTAALAVKAASGRVLATDIHPAAQIGAGFWLDHGLGFVAGETTVVGKDVSIWHNVTLGSTFNNAGPFQQRRPRPSSKGGGRRDHWCRSLGPWQCHDWRRCKYRGGCDCLGRRPPSQGVRWHQSA